MDFDAYIKSNFPHYAALFGHANGTPAEKEAAAFDLLRFHYPVLALNNTALPYINPVKIEESIQLLGFVGWPVLPSALSTNELLQAEVKSKFDADSNDGKHLALRLNLGLLGSAEYAVFALK